MSIGISVTGYAPLLTFYAFYANVWLLFECVHIAPKLRNKLETKSYLNSKLYFDIGEYKAAIQSLKGSLKGFPDTDYRE